MAISKPKVSSLIESQLPGFVNEDHQTFVAFLKAYYDYLETTQVDLKTLRDLDKTLDSFIKHFKNELGVNLPDNVFGNPRFLLQNIKDQYLAKGTESSYKLLFRLLFNKDISIDYPAKQMLRASDGKWNQDVSIIARVTSGHPDDIVGKLIDVVTPNKIIRVQVDRRQYIEVEVERVVEILPDVYEFYIDRRFFGDIAVGDRLRYKYDSVYFTADILATTSGLQVLKPGTGFRVGQLFNIKNGQGNGTIMKVTKTNSAGGIVSAEFIKFGIGYSTDFTSSIYADEKETSTTGTGGTVLSVIGSNVSISESTNGFSESGSINLSNYSLDAIDGTYAGEILREFGDSAAAASSAFEAAVIKVTLGSLAKYPGYYINNDGFLDDSIFIQDSRYYQAYSYVIKIDERLDTYKTFVKTLLHPAGMAVFGEYEIKNEFDISLELESMIKNLSITARDEVTMGVDTITSINMVKQLTDSTTYPDYHVVASNKYINNTGSGDDHAIPVDAGFVLLNPYGNAGWFAEDYVGVPTNFNT